MPKGALPRVLANRQRSSSAVAMENLIYLADLGNAIDEENIGAAGMHEIHPTSGLKLIVLDVTAGHNHDAANSKEVAGPSGANPGGVRGGSHQHTTAAWVEVNQGRMTTILFAIPLFSMTTYSASNHADSAPPGYSGSPSDLFTNRYRGFLVNELPEGPFVALDRDSTPHRLFVQSGRSANFIARILMVGT